MNEFDIDQELLELSAKEEVLAFFDFTLQLRGGQQVEGLCKISRARERRSRSTYCSVLFVVDAPDAETQRGVAEVLGRIDWGSFAGSGSGIDCVMPVPHRDSAGGLFLKEIDVYLDGSRAANAAFVHEVLRPAVMRAIGHEAGEVTVWDEGEGRASPSSEAEHHEGLFARLLRLAGRKPA